MVPARPGLIEQEPADSRAFWTFVFFGEMFIQVFHPFLKSGCFLLLLLLLNCESSLYILDIIPYQIYDLQIFFPIL